MRNKKSDFIEKDNDDGGGGAGGGSSWRRRKANEERERDVEAMAAVELQRPITARAPPLMGGGRHVQG